MLTLRTTTTIMIGPLRGTGTTAPPTATPGPATGKTQTSAGGMTIGRMTVNGPGIGDPVGTPGRATSAGTVTTVPATGAATTTTGSPGAGVITDSLRGRKIDAAGESGRSAVSECGQIHLFF